MQIHTESTANSICRQNADDLPKWSIFHQVLNKFWNQWKMKQQIVRFEPEWVYKIVTKIEHNSKYLVADDLLCNSDKYFNRTLKETFH